MDNSNSVFDNWTHVECNDCQHYWNALCDGTSKGSSKPCTAFVATRSTDIPAQIKWLRKAIKCLSVAIIMADIGIIALAIGQIIGG